MTAITVQNGGFTTEAYSDKVNVKLDKQGTYTDIVNRKYEGSIKNQNDRVTFYTIGNLAAQDYDPKNPNAINYGDPEGDKQTLIIDQIKVIPFKVGDIQQVWSNLDLVNQYTDRAAVAGAETKDAFIHGLAVAGAGTKLHDGSALALTKDNVWAEICKMGAVLKRKNALKGNVDYSGKRPALVVSPEVEGVILQAEQFFANAFGNEVLRKGQIGHIGIFDVFVNTVNGEAEGEQVMVALTSDAITYAEQITKTETLRDKDEIGDFVRSLMVYGGKVANPDCIVTNAVTVA
jgi:hypothetical protein